MYRISKEKSDIQFAQVQSLLKQTYWAANREEETIRTSIEHSICYSAFEEETKEVNNIL